MHLSLDKLRYEAVIHRRLADASMAASVASSSRSDSRAAVAPSTPITIASAPPSFPLSSSSPFAVRPHLRELSDFRLALVLPDQGGRLLLQWMEHQWRRRNL